MIFNSSENLIDLTTDENYIFTKRQPFFYSDQNIQKIEKSLLKGMNLEITNSSEGSAMPMTSAMAATIASSDTSSVLPDIGNDKQIELIENVGHMNFTINFIVQSIYYYYNIYLLNS